MINVFFFFFSFYDYNKKKALLISEFLKKDIDPGSHLVNLRVNNRGTILLIVNLDFHWRIKLIRIMKSLGLEKRMRFKKTAITYYIYLQKDMFVHICT